MSASIGYVESLVVYMKRLNTIVIVIYRPPPPTAGEDDFQQTMNKIRNCILELPDGAPSPTILLTGDFNFPAVRWADGDMGAATSSLRRQFEVLQQFAAENFMNQLINAPTRGMNTLELLYTNNEDIILNIETEETNISDHSIIFCATNYNITEA